MPSKKKAAEAVASPSAYQEDVVMEEAPEVPEMPKRRSDLDEAAAEQARRDPLAPSALAFGPDRITALKGSEQDAVSYRIEKEDHTLGNALRYIIMKNPDVEFCGYSIPHPSEDVMILRIQTYKAEGTADDALSKGLDDLIDLCDVVADKFKDARVEFMAGRETPDSK
ncbi:hypothetical protein B7494_g1251 [Chlorociboria aeruginascens]|nr:hypothetical protein B7494_g1251 [Chlorociboria aeruginascens]